MTLHYWHLPVKPYQSWRLKKLLYDTHYIYRQFSIFKLENFTFCLPLAFLGICPFNGTALATENKLNDTCELDTDCNGFKKCCDRVCMRPERPGLRRHPGKNGGKDGPPGGRRQGRHWRRRNNAREGWYKWQA